MKIVLATRNTGKIAELAAILRTPGVELISAGDLGGAPEVVEDGDTLESNARKKAVALAGWSGLPALADDTGLEVDALDGRPGVHSARFAGEDADDSANRRALIHGMQGLDNRHARFRTVLAFTDEGHVRYFEGVCEGHILHEERGTHGFGYDALFVPDGQERTFAEMSAAEKNAISHRARAMQAFAEYLRAQLPT